MKVPERTSQYLAIVVAAMASATCHDPAEPEPTGPPGITILAGADVTDSIDARPTQPLLIEVRNPDGRLARNVVVRFSGLPISGGGQNPPLSLGVGPIGQEPIRGEMIDTTDGSGQASAMIGWGAFAGPGAVEVTVPDLGFADTAHYTIQPGHGVSVVSEPEDTVVYRSRSFGLRVSVRDRHGNPRPDPVTFHADSTSASVSAAGIVTSQEWGRARVRIDDAAGHADTTWVSVIPEGTIAAKTDYGIVIVDLDGSNRRTVPGVAAVTWVDWNLTGDTLLFAAPDDDSWLYVTNTTSPPSRLITASTGLVSELWPQYSGDGQWIYFSGRTSDRRQAIWRARSDGSSPALIGYPSSSLDFDAAPSSDGSRVAFVSDRCCSPFSGSGLYLLHTQTGIVDSLAPGVVSPRWSPGDSLIAFVSQGVLVIRPDGQGLRQITPVGVYFWRGIDWSPTGEWLIARDVLGQLVLIRLADGLIIALPYFTDLDRPAWRP